MLRRVALLGTDFSEEPSASFIRVSRNSEPENWSPYQRSSAEMCMELQPVWTAATCQQNAGEDHLCLFL
jgi:hypothetical protein